MGFSSGDSAEIKRWVIFGIWIGINGICFGLYHRMFDRESRFQYFQELAGASFPVTRASAACINLNLAVILLPVCRNLIGMLRTISPKWIKQVYDADIRAHKTIAYMIIFWAVIHCLGHYWNLLNVTNSWILGSELANKLNDFGGINPVAPYSNITRDLFEIRAGYTGICLAVIFHIMLTTAAVPIRRSFFELFWYAHHVFILIYPILYFHGSGDLIKQQTNTDAHDPGYCSRDENLEKWGDAGDLCPAPEYSGLPPSSWKWFLPSLAVYAAETLLRIVHMMYPVEYVSHTFHPSNVLELRFSRNRCTIEGNKHKIGQFVFIKIPEASLFQWHPFTLTSAPEDEFMMVHIRAAGNWTRQIHKIFQSGKIPARIIVDGPYGSPSQGLYDHNIVLCAGTGIGITPFASFLRSLLYNARTNQIDVTEKKIYFVWIASSKDCFEWFDDLLTEVESEVSWIQPQIFLTMSNMNADTAQDLVVKERQSVMSLGQDPVSRMTKHRTKYGRPDWNEIFTNVSNENRNKHVSVFACGPKGFTKALSDTADKFSRTTNPWVQYHFYKENF